ncbi:kinase-like domain-containing protein [Gigaspora rosea]|uniref:Kinase-like domain-containing protein n=1 Tax=Gigaspora rosea TaxID=44941 RepID=A0A397VZ30_9GLOM|nr:kinase-like domain-containing protein [Gigaspora rosea]
MAEHSAAYSAEEPSTARPAEEPSFESLENDIKNGVINYIDYNDFTGNEIIDFTGSYRIVLQLADDGNLRKYLNENFSKLQWEDKFRIAKEIAQGLRFLHVNGVIHRDLHPNNILVHDNHMMISDFGLSKLTTSDTSNTSNSGSILNGMPAFLDPQSFINSKFSFTTKSDIYSFGVILWEISSGRKPFQSLKRYAIAIIVNSGEREKPIEGTPIEYEKLYKQCWDNDPEKRPTIEKVFDSLDQLIYKPTDSHVTTEKPSGGLLEKIISEKIIKFYDFNQFSNHIKISEERLGSVYKSKWEQKGLTVALKCLGINDKFLNQKIADEFTRKLKLLQNNFHHNITKFYGLTKDTSGEYYSMIFKFADSGNLRTYLADNFSKLQWGEKLHMAIGIAKGIKYLHDNGIVHRGLHSKNILICEGRTLIAGLGISELMNDTSLSTSVTRGMPEYIDPQCFRNNSYPRDMKSDIYSFGVILWEISSGHPPFKFFENGYAIAIHVFNGGREVSVEGTPIKYENLYKQCWDNDPRVRPDIMLVLECLNGIQQNYLF